MLFQDTAVFLAAISIASPLAIASNMIQVSGMKESFAHTPSARSVAEAKAALSALSAQPQRKPSRTLRIRRGAEKAEVSVGVPPEAFDLLLEILGHMANGNAVVVVPLEADLTTQEAADLLNVSRPFLITLVDSGKIPCRLLGTHRRIRASDVLRYKQSQKLTTDSPSTAPST